MAGLGDTTRSQTDLPGYLRSDGECLSSRLQEWFTALGVDAPAIVIKISFQENNALSWSPIMDGEQDAIVVESPTLAAIPNILDKIERMVTVQIGNTPFGKIRALGYAKGNSTKKNLTFQRTLLPGDMGALTNPDIRLVLQVNASLQAQITVLHSTVIAVVQHLSASNAVKDQTIAALATARTPATAASDLQSFGTLIALAGLIVFSPQIKAAMGLPSNATFADIVSQARKALSLAGSAQTDGFRMDEDSRPPPPRLEHNLEVDVEPRQGATRPAPVPATIDLPTVLRALDAMSKDPVMREAAVKEAMKNGDLRDALQVAYLEHLAKPSPEPEPVGSGAAAK